MRDFNEIRQNFYHKYSKEEVEKQLISFINQDLDLTSFDNKGKKYDKIINTFFEKIFILQGISVVKFHQMKRYTMMNC